MTGGTKIVPNPCHDRQLKPQGFKRNWSNSEDEQTHHCQDGTSEDEQGVDEDRQTGPGDRDACETLC